MSTNPEFKLDTNGNSADFNVLLSVGGEVNLWSVDSWSKLVAGERYLIIPAEGVKCSVGAGYMVLKTDRKLEDIAWKEIICLMRDEYSSVGLIGVIYNTGEEIKYHQVFNEHLESVMTYSGIRADIPSAFH